MTRFRLPFVAAAAALALAWLIVTAPARLLPLFLAESPLALSGLSGTLWRGEAARAALTGPGGTLQLGELRWRIEPFSLVTLAPWVALETVWGAQRLSLHLRQRGDRLEVRDADLSLDASLVRQLLPVELTGRLSAQFSQLTLVGQDLLQAEGRLVWQGAAFAGVNGLSRLGDYAAIVTGSAPAPGAAQGTGGRDGGAGAGIRATVETLSGPVRVEGSALLSGNRYRVDATVTSDGPMEASLAQALSLVAVPGENGYLLRLDGDLQRRP